MRQAPADLRAYPPPLCHIPASVHYYSFGHDGQYLGYQAVPPWPVDRDKCAEVRGMLQGTKQLNESTNQGGGARDLGTIINVNVSKYLHTLN